MSRSETAFLQVFLCLAKSGKGTISWCYGFKLRLLCNNSSYVITFCLTGADVDDRDSRVWTVFAQMLYERFLLTEGTLNRNS